MNNRDLGNNVRIAQDVDYVIKADGKNYRGSITLDKIACQCNAFKQGAIELNYSKSTQQKAKRYQQACLIVAELLGDASFLQEKLTQQARDNGSLIPKSLSLLANAFSYWYEKDVCRSAVANIAQHIVHSEIIVHQHQDFNAQDLANLANAFAKWSSPEDRECKAACRRIAEHLAAPACSLQDFKAQGLANLANAFAKWSSPEDRECKAACRRIAEHLAAPACSLQDFKAQELANLANAFAKWSSPEDRECKAACRRIAEHLAAPACSLQDFKAQELANLANAFAKWSSPEDRECKAACRRIAEHLAAPACSLQDFKAQELANLANALAKWSSPEDRECKAACRRIAEHLAAPACSLQDFKAQNLANLANAFAKWSFPEDRECKAACRRIAEHLAAPACSLQDFKAQELANLANALAKWSSPEDRECKAACRRIAEHLAAPACSLQDFKAQELANLANAFAKWSSPEDRECKAACRRIAEHLAAPACSLQDFKAQELANLANALAKWSSPEDRECKAACRRIAEHLAAPACSLQDFKAQDLANLANALAKWSSPEDKECKAACRRIAEHLAAPACSLQDFKAQDLANLANALAKWSSPEDRECKAACRRIAEHLAAPACSLQDFKAQELANLANALAKWSSPEDRECKAACRRIAEHLSAPACSLQDFKAQDLANLANALAKWSSPEDKECKAACRRIAEHLAAPACSLQDFKAQDLANLANALAKWSSPEDRECKAACRRIAEHLAAPACSLQDFKAQDLANLANALAKWSSPEDRECKAACRRIAEHLSAPACSLQDFKAQELANLANAFAKWCTLAQDPESAFNLARQIISQYLIDCPTAVASLNLLGIGMLLKAYRGAPREFAALTPWLLRQAEALVTGEMARPLAFEEEDLETLANVVIGLYPLLIKQPMAELGARACDLLITLQPVIARKQCYYLADPPTEAPLEAYQSRCLALSCYQLLKVYDQLLHLLKDKHVALASAAPDVHDAAPVTAIEAWVTRLLTQQGSDIVEFSAYGWNKIAALEAEYGAVLADDGSFDHFVERHAASLPAPAFNPQWRQRLEALTSTPQPPADPTSGKLTLQRCDAAGRAVAGEATRTIAYCLLGRLAGNTLSLVEVSLPGHPSYHLLKQLVYRDGIAFRMDLFGGNRMKPKSLTVEALLQQQPSEAYGTLVAVPLHETTAGSAFCQLLQQLFTYQESFFYAQRALLAQPLAGTASVLEGCFNLALFPDQTTDSPAPFRFKNGLQLRTHDGCGFIKQSVAWTMQGVLSHLASWPAAQAGSQERDSYLPAQALQHYAAADNNERLQQEVGKSIRRLLTKACHGDNDDVRQQALFWALSSGGMKGKSLVALPAADGQVHWCGAATDASAGLLMGRAPYSQANLRPIVPERIMTEGVTANFLRQQHGVLQYSLVASSSHDGSTPSLWFAKGLSVVIPDEIWPEAYQACHMVLSAEDIKMDSTWQQEKRRVTQGTRLQARGVLVVVDIFPIQCAIAIPPDEQRALSGDFDGDRVLVLEDYPHLYAHIQQQWQQLPPSRVLKPSKTFTSATNQMGHYQVGRQRQISTLLMGNVLQQYSMLQRAWLAVSWDRQRAVAAKIMADAVLLPALTTLAPKSKEPGSPSDDTGIELMRNILAGGINAGTDGFKADTHIDQFAAVASALQRHFVREKLPLAVPYGKKSLARQIRHHQLEVETAKKALQDNPNLAAAVMRQALAIWDGEVPQVSTQRHVSAIPATEGNPACLDQCMAVGETDAAPCLTLPAARRGAEETLASLAGRLFPRTWG